MDFITEITNCRQALRMSKHGLSVELGLSGDYIGKAESRILEPSLKTLRDIAKYFRTAGHPMSVDAERLLGVEAAETAA